jgi:hypothetical protein
MNLDVRIPMGMMFTMIGAVLLAFGLAIRGKTAFYAHGTGVNGDLWWGFVLLVFGVIVLTFGRRGQARIEKGRPHSPALPPPRRKR